MQRKKALPHLPERQVGLQQDGAQLIEGQIIGQSVRVAGLAQHGIGVGVDAARVGRSAQDVGGQLGLAQNARGRRADGVFQQLIDQIDVRQRRVGVRAVQQQRAEVAASGEQDIERAVVGRRDTGLALTEPHEEVRQIGCGA